MKKYLSLLFTISCLFAAPNEQVRVEYREYSNQCGRRVSSGTFNMCPGVPLSFTAFGSNPRFPDLLSSICSAGKNQLVWEEPSSSTLFSTYSKPDLLAAFSNIPSHFVTSKRGPLNFENYNEWDKFFIYRYIYDTHTGECLGNLTCSIEDAGIGECLRGGHSRDCSLGYFVVSGEILLSDFLGGLLTRRIIVQKQLPQQGLVARICAAFGRGAAD